MNQRHRCACIKRKIVFRLKISPWVIISFHHYRHRVVMVSVCSSVCLSTFKLAHQTLGFLSSYDQSTFSLNPVGCAYILVKEGQKIITRKKETLSRLQSMIHSCSLHHFPLLHCPKDSLEAHASHKTPSGYICSKLFFFINMNQSKRPSQETVPGDWLQLQTDVASYFR